MAMVATPGTLGGPLVPFIGSSLSEQESTGLQIVGHHCDLSIVTCPGAGQLATEMLLYHAELMSVLSQWSHHTDGGIILR